MFEIDKKINNLKKNFHFLATSIVLILTTLDIV
jgi:cell division protein ZapA (FtsZ GTPase activity inhibitor)